MRIFTLMSAVAAAINTRIILPLTFALMLLVVIDPTIATAHHREGHDKGDSGGGGGNEGRESFNSGALMGTMHRFDPSDDIAVSNKSKPPVATTELVVKSSRNSETRTFVKFTVTGVVGPVVSAKILLRSEATS